MDIQQRLHNLLTSTSPPAQAMMIQQVIVDSPPAYFREVAARLKEERGVEVLVKWMKESREQQAFALLGQVMKALKRLCSADWDGGLVSQLMEEVGRARGAVSAALRAEAEGLCKRMMELGLVQPSQVAAQAMVHLPALSAVNAQIAGTATIGMESAVRGEDDSKSAGAGSEGRSGDVVIVPSHPPPAAVFAAVERAKGRQRDSRRGQQRPQTVNASVKFRQQEEARRKEAERAMDREYQAGLGPPAGGEGQGGMGSLSHLDGRHPAMLPPQRQMTPPWGGGNGGVALPSPSLSPASAPLQNALATVQNLLALQSLKKLQEQVASPPPPHSHHPSAQAPPHPHHTNGFHHPAKCRGFTRIATAVTSLSSHSMPPLIPSLQQTTLYIF